jgi:hypothetical protein
MTVRTLALVFALATVVALAPASATAASTYTDTVSGLEYSATSTQGRFAGKASGQLPGYWKAIVDHTPLPASSASTAVVTGGSFALATSVSGVYTLVTGIFMPDGTINVTNSGPDCTNQTFAVEGTLGNVGPWYSGTGSGTFSAVLTHYRARIFGSCVTYSASVSGSLSLTF